jgi:hypothetical protein
VIAVQSEPRSGLKWIGFTDGRPVSRAVLHAERSQACQPRHRKTERSVSAAHGRPRRLAGGMEISGWGGWMDFTRLSDGSTNSRRARIHRLRKASRRCRDLVDLVGGRTGQGARRKCYAVAARDRAPGQRTDPGAGRSGVAAYLRAGRHPIAPTVRRP